MSKTATVRARVEPAIKREAEEILSTVGLTTSEAISLFLRQVALRRGLPFSVALPNEETANAIIETRAGKGTKTYRSVKDWAKAARRA